MEIAILLLAAAAFVVVPRISSQEILGSTPPRGWNSYDSFSWIVSEDEFLANAAVLASSLKQSGYEYAVVDFLWFRKNQDGVTMSTPGFDSIDAYGRPVPDPVRWPSTANGKGFAPIAAKVHAMGLKFGIHVMRGISASALQHNTPVLGAKGWTAKDIALSSRPCSWMRDCFFSVNTSTDGGKAFINSLYQQYASWDVDFVKHDCVFGKDDLSLDEIQAVSQAILATGRPMVYSLSPGVSAVPAMGKSVASYVHMYRVTSDDWDSWGDLQLHFDVASSFASAGLIGASGLGGGRSWPDLDMLPLGWLTDPGVRGGPHRYSALTSDEQKLQMTLWAMAKSPLIYGGDLRKIDKETLNLITNPVMLDINSHSFVNGEISAEARSGDEAAPVLRMVACDKATHTQWVIKDQKNLCWSVPKYNNGSSEQSTGCMDWSETSAKTDTGSARLWSLKLGSACLDAHGTNPGHYENFASSRVAACSRHRHSSQQWKLVPGVGLVNKKTGRCAAIYPQVNVSRIWSARGSDGEYYLAFFNLGSKTSKMSVAVEDVVSRKKAQAATEWQCNALDVWSNANIGVVTELQASVPAHGCALFSLTCDSNSKHG